MFSLTYIVSFSISVGQNHIQMKFGLQKNRQARTGALAVYCCILSLGFENAGRFADRQERITEVSVQYRSTCTIQGHNSDSHFSVCCNGVENVRSYAESVKRQAKEQEVDQNENDKQYFIRFNRTDRHEQGEYEVSGKSKSELLAIGLFSESGAKYAHFDHPVGSHCKPEECVRTKSCCAKGIVAFGILNTCE